jgi:lysophospholipase L1-like esterase
MSRCRQRRRLVSCAALLAFVSACSAVRPSAPEPSQPTPTPSPTASPTPVPSPTAAPELAHDRRNVVLVGDSTTFGTPEPRPGVSRAVQSPYNPAAALETLLAHLEPLPANGGTPWRGARVHNLGVGASTTALWLEDPPPYCNSPMELFPVIKAACAKGVPWIAATRAAIGGAPVDVVIVDLGLNDLLSTPDPNETVNHLVRIKKKLAPIPVIFFPPIAPPDGPRGDWPKRVRAAMTKRRLFDEPQYPPYLPTFDGLHETDGGYAAKAALYLDALRKLP